MSRSNETQLITCYACGKPLFLERHDSGNKYHREKFTDKYFYDEISNIFICNNCYGETNEIKKR